MRKCDLKIKLWPNGSSQRHNARDQKDAPIIWQDNGEDRMGVSKPEVFKKKFFERWCRPKKAQLFHKNVRHFVFLKVGKFAFYHVMRACLLRTTVYPRPPQSIGNLLQRPYSEGWFSTKNRLFGLRLISTNGSASYDLRTVLVAGCTLLSIAWHDSDGLSVVEG